MKEMPQVGHTNFGHFSKACNEILLDTGQSSPESVDEFIRRTDKALLNLPVGTQCSEWDADDQECALSKAIIPGAEFCHVWNCS